MDSKDEEKLQSSSVADMTAAEIDVQGGELLNSSGHVQELDRTFGVWSVIGVAIVYASLNCMRLSRGAGLIGISTELTMLGLLALVHSCWRGCMLSTIMAVHSLTCFQSV